MTLGGWIFMICSLAFVISLVAFCYYKVLSRPSAADHMHAPIEIDTHDKDT